MVNHVVLFKLKDYPEEEKGRILAELKAKLEALKNSIPEIKFIEVGLNYQLDSKSYDLCLLSHFETIEELDTYRVHPEHLKIFERIKETTVSRTAVDYIF